MQLIETTELVLATVTVEESCAMSECYLTPKKWNGWEMPLFTLEQGLGLIDRWKHEQGVDEPGLYYDADKGRFMEINDGDATEAPVHIAQSPAGEIELHEIGIGWTWRKHGTDGPEEDE